MLAAALFATLVFHFVSLRTDMADFLPVGRTLAARLMLDEIRTGPAASMILIGIEGAPTPALARISQALVSSLDRSGQFALIENGEQRLGGREEKFLFGHRYLLSSVTTPAAFDVPALQQDFQRLLAELSSSAAPLVEQFGLADPPGAFQQLIQAWTGGSRIRSADGVWFAADRDRALILVRTRANGLDLKAQDLAQTSVRNAFAAAQPGTARLLVSGPAVFAHDVANDIRHDVRLLSIISTLLIITLLIWRFRSPLVIAAIAVTMLLSISTAALAVQLVFGFVHGIAFGFGMTMLGVTVDYPVLLIGHRKRAEQAAGTLQRIGPTFNLAVLTAALGLTGMMFSGFPGVAQLGLFSVVGVFAAAATTRWVLPPLIVAADLAPVSAGDPVRLLRIERLRAWRYWGLLPVVAAAVYLLTVGGPHFETNLTNLSPISRNALELDATLRTELGAPDVGQMVILRGDSAENVLRREEAALPIVDKLQQDKVIGGAEIAARLLPSAATQLARRAALPPPDTLKKNVAQAQTGMSFRNTAFQPFVADVTASRELQPVTLADLTSPLVAARLQPLIFRNGSDWYGLIVPREVTDDVRLVNASRRIAGATYVDVGNESNNLVSAYTRRAGRWLALGALAALLLLAIGLRDLRRLSCVVGAVGAAGLVTVAILTAAGERLSLIQIVSLQFVAGVGLDYALFYARRQLDAEERARTLRTLATCNAMTLLTFGLLTFCRTPLLRQMGGTVAIGAVAAMIFAFLFAGLPPQPETEIS